MKANELRVNNWIERKFWNPHPNNPSFMWDKCTVDAIYAGRVNCRLDKSTVIKLQYEDIRPIPLAPELLERCGFVKEPPRHYTLHFKEEINGMLDVNIYFGDDGEILFQQLVGGGYYQGVDVPVTSLHQLQNLFYCLTGNELEVKM